MGRLNCTAMVCVCVALAAHLCRRAQFQTFAADEWRKSCPVESQEQVEVAHDILGGGSAKAESGISYRGPGNFRRRRGASGGREVSREDDMQNDYYGRRCGESLGGARQRSTVRGSRGLWPVDHAAVF